MATPVLIIGRSGTGKSTSLRNCVGNDNWNLIRVLDKPLPFKGKINGWYSDDYQQIMKLLIASKAKNIVIDDAGYLITNMFMNKHSSAGGGNGVFTLYNQIGDHFWNLLQFISTKVPADKINRNDLSDNERCYRYLKDKIAMNEQKFDAENKVEQWGILEEGRAIIYNQAFKDLCKNGGFSDKAFLSWADRKGLIETQGGRMTKVKKVGGNPVRCVFLKLNENLDEDGFESVLSVVDNVQNEMEKIESEQEKAKTDPVMTQMFGGAGDGKPGVLEEPGNGSKET